MKIVFFDGYCSLCNGLVDFLMKADTRQRLRFASLQGETARKMLTSKAADTGDTVIFLNNGERSERSTAILQILAELGGAWTAARWMLVLPPPLRDFFYRLVAQNRYRWFGKRDSCRIPTPEEASRLLP